MTAGSRGDVAPFTGLAYGLAQAGHEVTLVTHGSFAPLVAGSGVAFHPLPVDPRTVLESEQGLGLHRSTTGPGKLWRAVTMARTVADSMTDDLLTAARTSDALLLSASVAPLGYAIAEGLRLPSLGLNLQPVAPTREFAPPMLGGGSWGTLGNRMAGHGVGLAIEHVFAKAVPNARTRLGLPHGRRTTARRDRDRRNWPVLHGFSPRVVPRPRDWRPGLDVAGYWWPYDVTTQLPPEVETFLAEGPPPVFVGLGSATVPNPEHLSTLIVRALRQAGVRGIFQRGWAGLSAEGDDMLTVGEIAHSALFPHMAAIIHHAGAGTTAAALRAGVPAIPVPIQFDAGFWSTRLTTLGVAPTPVPLRRLTTDALTSALTQVTRDTGYRERAQQLGVQIREENGITPVLKTLNHLTG
ncbi:glycosyltransferase [Streptomyces sp. NPDC046909]|uniref:glycosyltransferase n=1 Tax=Streptomyces sp. NPDC046909 TaxID=3155617 RepID=UPI0033C8BE08